MQSKANDLEAIEKLVQRYQHTRHMKKAAMDLNMTILANHQATIIAQPGNRALNFPTTLVALLRRTHTMPSKQG